MIFPKEYSILNRNVFQKDDYKLVPIRFEDRLQIMKWRNEQVYHLRQDKLLTEADQDSYFEHTVSKLFLQEQPNQLLFSYLKNDICIGYGGLVHINWIDRNAEISFIMKTDLEKNHFHEHWSTYLGLLEEVAFSELKLHKVFTYAFDLRAHLYTTLEQNGYQEEARLAEHCYFNGQYIDVVIHKKINPSEEIRLRPVMAEDLLLVYKWSNDPLVRSQSFNTASISQEEHKRWFQNKLKSEKDIILIGELNGEPFGMVRFNIDKLNSSIGVLLDAGYRGKGLATPLLKGACTYFFKKEELPIHAYIKKSNKASIKAFERAQFKFEKETIIEGTESLLYIRFS